MPTVRAIAVPTLADFADMGTDILEIAGGEYTPGRINISGIDRSSRPLIIRPASGKKVIWNGGAGSDGAFYFGYPTLAPARGFTFDGRNGAGSAWLFTNYNLGSTGIFWVGGSSKLKFLGLTFSGNTGIKQGQNSHSFYLSNNTDPGSNPGRCYDIEIAYCQIDGGNRTVTGSQCYHDPGPYDVDFHDNEVTNCDTGCLWATIQSTYMRIRNNTFTDCDRAIAVDGPQGVARGNTSHNAPATITAPFVDDGTNHWG
jgi:hypothetical protein